MVGMLYRTKRGGLIYACIDIHFEHVPIMTLICIENGDKWIVKGLRNLERFFEPLVPTEEE